LIKTAQSAASKIRAGGAGFCCSTTAQSFQNMTLVLNWIKYFWSFLTIFCVAKILQKKEVF